MQAQIAYTIPDFCTAAGIGRTRVYEEISSGRLQVFRAGRRTLISVEGH